MKIQFNLKSGTLTLLGIAFIVLKLTNAIHWSWWLVTLPFWGFPALYIGLPLLWFLLPKNKAPQPPISNLPPKPKGKFQERLEAMEKERAERMKRANAKNV